MTTYLLTDAETCTIALNLSSWQPRTQYSSVFSVSPNCLVTATIALSGFGINDQRATWTARPAVEYQTADNSEWQGGDVSSINKMQNLTQVRFLLTGNTANTGDLTSVTVTAVGTVYTFTPS